MNSDLNDKPIGSGSVAGSDEPAGNGSGDQPMDARNILISNPKVKMNVNRAKLFLGPLGPKLIPRRSNDISETMQREKMSLPVFKYKDKIATCTSKFSVFIINGETGSGKSTQVPQFILEEAHREKKPCRILVTQPRRVAAISLASRVAEERGESVGDVVGYQIKMDNCIKQTSNLIYVTAGILLRSFIGNNSTSILNNITHLIFDEIHERDRFTDFMLITVKEYLKHNKNLCVILMSATMDIEQLSKYFDNCPILRIPGQSFDVKIFHLEDILYHSGYTTDKMRKYLRSMEDSTPSEGGNESAITQLDKTQQEMLDTALEQSVENISKIEKDYELIFLPLRMLIEDENVSVDAAHSKTGLTPLMAACKIGCLDYVEYFMRFDANMYKRDNQGLSAIDYARKHTDDTCLRFLKTLHMNLHQSQLIEDEEKEKMQLLKAYENSFNSDDEVDHNMVCHLIEELTKKTEKGAIIVFLPGYSDIYELHSLIRGKLPEGTYRICILHSQMKPGDQVDALQISAMRKIILSTNIGQTSITIPDLVYVIDAGKGKQNYFDAETESSQLQTMWIAKADASQRSGRAGRTQNGICYRLYSREKFENMTEFSTPDFLRISLSEFCLYAKTLEGSLPVKDYFQRALNPPEPVRIESASKRLKLLKVFNEDESVTKLGKILVELPVDINLGVCLIYGIFFQCIDPILTIVAFHSVKDPFIIPTDSYQKQQAAYQRKSFASNRFSDQYSILVLYDEYSAVRNNYARRHEFCSVNYLSESAMESFFFQRCQLRDLVFKKFRLNKWASSRNDNKMIKMCLIAGFYPNIAMVDRERQAIMGTANTPVKIHHTSVLFAQGIKNQKLLIQQITHNFVIFFEKMVIRPGGDHPSTSVISMNAAVEGILIALQCGFSCDMNKLNFILKSNNSKGNQVQNDKKDVKHLANTRKELELQIKKAQEMLSKKGKTQQKTRSKIFISLNNWMGFEISAEDAKLLVSMRALLQALFNEFLRAGHTPQVRKGLTIFQKLIIYL